MRWRPEQRWLGVGIGVLAVALGAALTLRPYDSLEALTFGVAAALVVTGVGELLESRHEAHPWSSRVLGVVLIVTGALIVALPGLSASSVALVAGAGLAVAGVARLVAVARRQVEAVEWWIALLGGIACLVLGVLAIGWPDVTTLAVALLVGPVVVILGIRQIVLAWRYAHRDERRRAPGWLRLGGAVAALVLAGALAAASAVIHEEEPRASAFYDTPDALPGRPGQLIRDQRTDDGVPDGQQGWRILYTTTDRTGKIVPASGLVIAAEDPSGPQPVLLWDHGTTGVARDCAPSVLPDPFKAGGMPVVPEQAAARGWAVVAPDYPGLGAKGAHEYLVGVPEGRSGLDAVRAARQLRGVELGPKTVVWGHSQGGGAALWTGIEAARYAPDVPLAGVAALAPASDLPGLVDVVQDNSAGRLFATFAVFGYAAAYRDVRVREYIRPSALPAVRGIASRCLAEPAILLSLPSVLADDNIFRRDLTSGPLGRRLRQNVPRQPTRIPTLIAQGADDELVVAGTQRRFAARLCRDGQPLQYREFAGRDHLSVVADDSPLIPELVGWTESRFAGAPMRDACPTPER